MPRIIVTTDPVTPASIGDASILLSESVRSVHLSTEHAAEQLVERLAWAVTDAERAEMTHGAKRSAGKTPDGQAAALHSAQSSSRSRARARDAVAA